MCRDERVQTPRHQATDGIPTRLLPVVVVGPNADGYRSSTGRTPGLDREAAGSNPAESKTRPHLLAQRVAFDGSQDWVIVDNDAVAGSSPASGSKGRSSSVAEHVDSQFVFYPSVL